MLRFVLLSAILFNFVAGVAPGTSPCTGVRAQTSDYFGPQRLPGNKLDFLTAQAGLAAGDQERIAALEAALLPLADWRVAPPDAPLRIGDTSLTAAAGTPLLALRSPGGEDWLSVFAYATDDGVDPRQMMWEAVGAYTGRGYFAACFYLKPGPEDVPSTVQFMALLGSTVISGGTTLPFALPATADAATPAQLARYQTAVASLDRRIDSLLSVLVAPADLIYLARPERTLTAAERTFGLVQFWTEAKYNFAYFDQVPELDWDAALQEYLPRVAAEQSDTDYYRLLERFCALLEDGHTNVYPPAHLRTAFDRPRLGVELIGGQPVVVNRSRTIGETVPLGSRIVAVGGTEVPDYLEREIYPYIAAGGDHVRRRWGAHDLLKGPVGSEVTFTFVTPTGERRTATLPRDRSAGEVDWEVPRENRPLTSFEVMDGAIGYLQLNAFDDDRAVEEFLGYLPRIAECRGLVIDLRHNGGGHSGVGYGILKHFTDRPLATSAWRTREHRAASRAWGRPYAKADPATLSEWNRGNREMYLGNHWYVADADTILPAEGSLPDLPVAVLVSNYTASAAEDFLVAADALEQFTFVGEPSYGSTGQPLMLLLPGGGNARICTKRDTYADGRVFVGPGVGVDVAVSPTVEQHLAQEDVVLARALQMLKGDH